MIRNVLIIITLSSMFLFSCLDRNKKDPLEDIFLLLFLQSILNPPGVCDGGTPADPLYRFQWHLKNNGDTPGAVSGADARVEEAWKQCITGKNVNIVVIDDGVDIRHEDLRINSALNIDFTGSLPNQVQGIADCNNPGNACHGTAVAGIAAGFGNGIGVSGASRDALIGGRNLLFNLTNANSQIAMADFASQMHISNNSWGAADTTGKINDSLANTQWRDGIVEGLTNGRNGKGSLYFWAAGNGASIGSGFPDIDNSNYDGQANFYGVMAVGAIGNNDKRASYSERGANLWVSAHSEGTTGVRIATTDIMGTAGYNFNSSASPFGAGFNNNYTNTFNGTSAATPLAAGVAGLVLEANPNLTWRDAKLVLAKSARKVDPDDVGAANNCDAAVFNCIGWTTNSAGVEFNDKYGFGAVDATAAVNLAKSWTNVGTEIVSSLFENVATQTIVDFGDEVTKSINVSGTGIGKIEFVEVNVTINSAGTNSGDLRILIQSPGGKKYQLAGFRPCLEFSPNRSVNCPAYNNWRFGVTSYLDEPADGTWTLIMEDFVTGANPYNFNLGTITNNATHTGNHTFNSWSLRIRGRAN